MNELENVFKKEKNHILKSLVRWSKDITLAEDALQTGYMNCMIREHTNLFTESWWALSKIMRNKNYVPIDDVMLITNFSRHQIGNGLIYLKL